MTRFRLWLLPVYSATLALTIFAIALLAGSFFVEFRSAGPWPDWLPSPGSTTCTGTYCRVDLNDGRLAFSQIRPLTKEQAIEQRLNPLPNGGYRFWGFGLVPNGGVWFPLGAKSLWYRSISLPFFAALLVALSLVLGLMKSLSRR